MSRLGNRTDHASIVRVNIGPPTVGTRRGTPVAELTAHETKTLSGANRYAILYRVQDAKRPETRARRIATFVAMCHNHETLH
jgi:hypothetical protein